MAIGKETYVALLAVTFGLIMVQMQTTVYGQIIGKLYGTNRSDNNTNNSTNNNSTNNNSTNPTNSTKPIKIPGATNSTGGTPGGNSNGTNSNLWSNCGIYKNCTNQGSASALTSSSPVTVWFRLLLHVIMAVSFLQIIQ